MVINVYFFLIKKTEHAQYIITALMMQLIWQLWVNANNSSGVFSKSSSEEHPLASVPLWLAGFHSQPSVSSERKGSLQTGMPPFPPLHSNDADEPGTKHFMQS